jgi:hypothetical protein
MKYVIESIHPLDYVPPAGQQTLYWKAFPVADDGVTMLGDISGVGCPVPISREEFEKALARGQDDD